MLVFEDLVFEFSILMSFYVPFTRISLKKHLHTGAVFLVLVFSVNCSFRVFYFDAFLPPINTNSCICAGFEVLVFSGLSFQGLSFRF